MKEYWGKRNNKTSSIDDYQFKEELGQGTFTIVNLAKHKKTGIKVAIKTIKQE
jgi:serine/threonine protein kinase